MNTMSAFGDSTFDDDAVVERVVGVSDAARRRLLAPPRLAQLSSAPPRLPSLPDPLARRRSSDDDDAGITLRTEDDDEDDDDDDSTFSLGNNDARSEASLQQAASASSVRALSAGGASGDDSNDEPAPVRPRARPIILRRRQPPRVEEPDDSNAPMDERNSVPNAIASTVNALAGGDADSLGIEILGDRDAASCPLCWEEQPHIDDSSMRTAMVDRMSDFRRIIFRFERMMAGRQSDEVIFRGMLELRQRHIEKDLRRYSGNRFRPWTMDALRRHYSPLSGHRFDIVRELDKQLADMRRQRQWIMEHAMFVVHPDSGERVFNIRAVETMTRLEREYEYLYYPTSDLSRSAMH